VAAGSWREYLEEKGTTDDGKNGKETNRDPHLP